ncbi:tail protein [Pseudomonas phage PspYZU01]|uniref:Tip attachment protein J domain-containing protein n=1 Tax=Pseudomonas phage PspYZU01 TaxID=1983555 RepID=A0A2U7N2D4_9CAUD|nr:tail protein [Pseudomonas phage PspYZU01]ASD51915.1 hypothetical protein PspYZU01_30 [Pseudomonas phage PspYZU01]
MSGGKKKPKNRAGNYFMSVHYGVADEVDEFNGLWVNETKIPTVNWQTFLNERTGLPIQVQIEQPNIFGGNSKQGGLTGYMDIHFGSPMQIVTPALAQRLGKDRLNCPGFRGVTSLFFHNSRLHGGVRGFQWSTNQPVLPAVWATVTRQAVGVGGEKRGDGNGNTSPAFIIFECLSNTQWGMGCPLGLLDTESFSRAADTLAAENFWMSMIWSRSDTVENFVGEVLDHIQASLVTSPRTGKLTLNLLRADYNRNDLRLIHPGNAKITKMQRKVWGETVNEVNVSWTNPENEEEETVTAQDNGNVAIQGAIISTTRNYYGVRDAGKAMQLAERDLRQSATPLLSIDATLQREFWDLVVGEVVEVRWPEYGLGSIIMRVGAINYGKPGATEIQVSLLEDIFSFGAAVWDFTLPPPPKPGDRPAPLPPPKPGVVIPEPPKPVVRPPQGSEWVPPVSEPVQPAQVFLTTAPFFMLAQEYGDDTLRTTPYPAAQICQSEANAVAGVMAYNFWSDEADVNGVTTMTNQGRMIPDTYGRTTAPVGRLTTKITYLASALMGPPPVAGQLLFLYVPWTNNNSIDDPVQEICGVLTVNTLPTGYVELTVNRGCLDTVPRAWPVNTPFWCLDADGDSLEPLVRADGEPVRCQFQPVNQAGSLGLEQLAVFTLNVSDRMHCPYRPAGVRVNGNLDPTPGDVFANDLTITWANRNRWEESGRVLTWTDASVNPEPQQRVRLTLKGSAGEDLGAAYTYETPAFTGSNAVTSYTFPALPTKPADGKVVLTVVSILHNTQADADLVSQPVTFVLTVDQLPGYGNAYGQNYGGNN